MMPYLPRLGEDRKRGHIKHRAHQFHSPPLQFSRGWHWSQPHNNEPTKTGEISLFGYDIDYHGLDVDKILEDIKDPLFPSAAGFSCFRAFLYSSWGHLVPTKNSLSCLVVTHICLDWVVPGCCCYCLVTKSCLTLCDPMNCIALQAPLSMGFSKQEYRSGLPFPTARDLPDPGIKPVSLCVLHWRADSLPLQHLGSPTKGIPN